MSTLLWLRERAAGGPARWHRPADEGQPWSIGKTTATRCRDTVTVDYAARVSADRLPHPACAACSSTAA